MIHITGRARLHIVAGSIALISTLMLTGCTNLIHSAIDDAIGSQVSGAAGDVVDKLTNGEVQGLGSNEIPADFPSTVPLPDREPVSAVRHMDENGITWMLQFDDSSGPAEVSALGAELMAEGFAEESNTSFGDAMTIALYTTAELTVTLTSLGEEGDRVLQLLVMKPEGQ